MASKAKTPATVTMAELAEIAEKASRRAGREAREAGIVVAGIEVPQSSDRRNPVSKKPAKQRV